jgi:hypothetical protein
LFNAAEAATNILKEAAGTPFTKAEVAIQPSPDGEYTVLTLQFVVQHLGSVVPLNGQHEEPVPTAAPEPHETPQEPAGDAETVLPYYQTEEQLALDQTPCGRCHWAKWRHYVDDQGGFATCTEFVDAKQLTLSLSR